MDPDLYSCERCGQLTDDDADCDCQVDAFWDEDDESERHMHPDFALTGGRD